MAKIDDFVEHFYIATCEQDGDVVRIYTTKYKVILVSSRKGEIDCDFFDTLEECKEWIIATNCYYGDHPLKRYTGNLYRGGVYDCVEFYVVDRRWCMEQIMLSREERYHYNQNNRGLKKLQIWIPECDVARFKANAAKSRYMLKKRFRGNNVQKQSAKDKANAYKRIKLKEKQELMLKNAGKRKPKKRRMRTARGDANILKALKEGGSILSIARKLKWGERTIVAVKTEYSNELE